MSQQAPAHAAAESGSAAPRGRKIPNKLKIAGVIVGIVAIEWVVAYLYLPSAAPASTVPAAPAGESETPAEEKHDEAAGHGAHGAAAAQGASTKASHGGQQEIDLGEFTVTAYQPVSNSTLFISFHLYGSVPEKFGDEFGKRLDDNKHRIRDNIIVIIRSAEITDLTDAGLGLIKRRILETTNKALGKPLLQGVMFSEFSFVEQ